MRRIDHSARWQPSPVPITRAGYIVQCLVSLCMPWQDNMSGSTYIHGYAVNIQFLWSNLPNHMMHLSIFVYIVQYLIQVLTQTSCWFVGKSKWVYTNMSWAQPSVFSLFFDFYLCISILYPLSKSYARPCKITTVVQYFLHWRISLCLTEALIKTTYVILPMFITTHAR
jgi:hypothetical protein